MDEYGDLIEKSSLGDVRLRLDGERSSVRLGGKQSLKDAKP